MNTPASTRPVGHDKVEPALHQPVLHFNLSAEVEQLRRTDSWRTSSGPSATTLVHHADLRVVLAAMRRGVVMSDHRTVARITVHALEGRLRLRLPDRTEVLGGGELLVLDRGIVHDVEALEDSALLLTLAWPTEENCP